MRKTEKVRAIVIKSTLHKEKDRLLKLLCSDGRIMNVMSKGAESLKGKNRASSMLFCLSDFDLSYTGDMAFVSSSEVIKSFSGIRKNIIALTAASYISEEASFTEGSDMTGDDSLYRLLGHTLVLLEKSEEESFLMLALSFVLKLCGIIGIAPQFERCASCGEESEYYFFSSHYGGTVCPVCAGNFYDEAVLTKDEARYLKLLMYIDIRKIPSLTFPHNEIRLKMLGCVNGYVREYFHKKNNSYDMLIGLFNI